MGHKPFDTNSIQITLKDSVKIDLSGNSEVNLMLNYG